MASSTAENSDIECTAKLLQDLRVGRSPRTKHMDSMEMDLVLEVPDAPDRLATTRPAEDAGEEPARDLCRESSGSVSIHGGPASPSNASDDESLFRKARQARLPSSVSKPHDAKYHIKKKVPFVISYPTRCRNNRKKMTWDMHEENKGSCYDQLKGAVSSPSRSIGKTHNGIVKSLELADDDHGAEGVNEISIDSVVSKHCSMNSFAESNCNVSRTSLASDSQATDEKAASGPYPRQFERKRPVRNGLISLSNIKEKIPSSNGESSSSSVGRCALDRGKGIDSSKNSQNKSEYTLFQPSEFDVPGKNSGQRRLVQSGCISPVNIAKNGNLTDCKGDGIGKLDADEVIDEFSSSQLHVITSDSESKQTDGMKEKESPNDDVKANGQGAKSSFMSSRELLLPGEGTTISAEAFTDIWPADNIGLRATHNWTGKTAQLLFEETSVVSNREDDSFHPSDRHHVSLLENMNVNMLYPHPESISSGAGGPFSFAQKSNPSQFQQSSEVNFDFDPDNEQYYGVERPTRVKRKSISNQTLLGECSSSAFTESEVFNPQSSWETSSANSMRCRSSQCHGVMLGPIIDVDELPSPVLESASGYNGNSISSEESVARDQQVESDEMLARQLQEQFFNESPDIGGTEEIDATIAWALQQEEAVRHASLIREHGQSHPRSLSVAHLYRQYPRQSSQSSSVQSTSRVRVTPSARMAQLQRNMRHEMDLETRLDLLEALEMTFNNDNDLRSNILHVQRDFNENDYEMLLALDDDNYNHIGASHHQINSLPQTVIQTDNVEEACAICLEKPSIGDTIRHLPCLHKFHKKCIDTWLQRRISCPICKSEIT